MGVSWGGVDEGGLYFICYNSCWVSAPGRP